MNTSELWRLSKKVYKEIVFQSYFLLRTGGTLPQTRETEKDILKLAKSAEQSFTTSKVVLAIFISFISIPAFFSSASLETSKSLAIVSSVSYMLLSILFIMVFMELQVVTSFVSSRVAELLIPLPVSSKDVSKILLMCLIRIFDIPLIASALVTPIAYLVSYRSILGALTVFLSVLVTEVYALAIAISLALSFYYKVVKGSGRSAFGTVIRIFYMLLWIVPMFLMYAATSFAAQMFSLMKTFTQSFSYLLTFLYPFSLSFLVSFVTFFKFDDPKVFTLSLSSSLIYIFLALYTFKWLTRRVIEIGFGNIVTGTKFEVKEISINPGPPWLGILKKDLRIASRSPSYFSVLVLPAMETAILGLSFGTSSFFVPFAFSLFFVLLLPPSLLSIESIAYSYVGSLPLRRRSLILAKSILSSIAYLLSLLVLLIIVAVRSPSFLCTFALFGGILTLSVVASIIFETLLFSRIFGQNILAGNLYSKLHSYILPLIFSFVIAVIPILIYFVTLYLTDSFALSITSLTLTSILEFSIALLLMFIEK